MEELKNNLTKVQKKQEEYLSQEKKVWLTPSFQEFSVSKTLNGYDSTATEDTSGDVS